MRRKIQDHLADDVVRQAQTHPPSFGQRRVCLQRRTTAHDWIVLAIELFCRRQPVKLRDKPCRGKVSAQFDTCNLYQHPQSPGQTALSSLRQQDPPVHGITQCNQNRRSFGRAGLTPCAFDQVKAQVLRCDKGHPLDDLSPLIAPWFQSWFQDNRISRRANLSCSRRGLEHRASITRQPPPLQYIHRVDLYKGQVLQRGQPAMVLIGCLGTSDQIGPIEPGYSVSQPGQVLARCN